MSTKQKIEDYKERRKVIELGGGEDANAKQHSRGKLTARERVIALLDEGSFVETGAFTEHRCSRFGMDKKKLAGDGVITGYGTIDGRMVFLFAHDFTIAGGSLGEMQANRIVEAQKMALQYGCPFIGINDCGGARIQEAVDSLQGYGKIFYQNVMASGVVPQISLIAGPCAGGAAYSPALTDFIIMEDKLSQMFITGPEVVKSVTGEEIDKESLGGAMTNNSISGNAHYFATDEEDGFDTVRRILSYLPSNNMEAAPVCETADPFNRLNTKLNDIVPDNDNKAYDMIEVIEEIVDDGVFDQYMMYFAKNMITGYARIGGRPVGIVANQPKEKGGAIDKDASDKAARFIRTCDAFNVPLVTLVDVPGYFPGIEQEYGGIIRHGAKLLYAFSEATVPKITIEIRKSYGGAHIGMCGKTLGADFVFAWPTAIVAVMGAAGAANIVFSKEIKASADPAATKAEKAAEYEKEFNNPYMAAARGFVDDIILPEDTRRRIIDALQVCETKNKTNPAKKHGNVPL